MDLGLRGRTALVAGSTSGLGLAIARVLSREHANVVITGRRAALAEQRAAELTGAIGVGLDLAEPATTAAAVDRAVGTFGAIDVLVLNAGGPPPGPAAELTGMSMAESANVLLLAQIDLVSAVLPGMRERGWGRVLAIGSSGVRQPILEAGHRISVPVPRTIADGQAATIPGELTFAINQRLVEAIALVTDDEIREAMRFALTRLKIVVEPSGATGLAALLCGRVRRPPRRIGVIVSGGNLDL